MPLMDVKLYQAQLSCLLSLVNHNSYHEKKTLSIQEIATKLARLHNQLNSFMKKTPEKLEEVILECSKSIHNDHLALIEVKYMTAMMYGNIKGFHYKGRFSILLCNIFNILPLFRSQRKSTATKNWALSKPYRSLQ